MNDAAPNGALLAEGFNFGHNIMSNLGLDVQGARYVNVVNMGAQINNLFLGYQPKLSLSIS
jgi:hypothetical protein